MLERQTSNKPGASLVRALTQDGGVFSELATRCRSSLPKVMWAGASIYVQFRKPGMQPPPMPVAPTAVATMTAPNRQTVGPIPAANVLTTSAPMAVPDAIMRALPKEKQEQINQTLLGTMSAPTPPPGAKNNKTTTTAEEDGPPPMKTNQTKPKQGKRTDKSTGKGKNKEVKHSG